MNTVSVTVEKGLCCSCGICKGMCPKSCIEYRREKGIYLPVVDEAVCVSCGLCAAVCPGLGHTYEQRATAEETITGSVMACFNAWSKDPDLRHVSASGGVISTMIQNLLVSGRYDGAFCLDSYDYHNQLKTRLYTAEEVEACWRQSNAPKSRYLPVSHENAVYYMKKNREKKLIFVGTSCAIRGLKAAVKKLNLNEAQYLFVGLFCDKVFNYNVLPYFEDVYAHGAKLQALHFKNKESGGWPGDMKFFPEHGDVFYVPLEERAKAKAYFMPERCLYCVDKLNVCADISLGDNYTGKDESRLGSNSVIIRTEVGKKAWDAVKDKLVICDIGIVDIQNAQVLEWRLKNMYFGDLRTKQIETNLNAGVPREKPVLSFEREWKASIQKLSAGAVYDTNSEMLRKQIYRDNRKPNPGVRFVKRAFGFIKRRIMRGNS